MGSKIFLLLGISLAIALLNSSDVVARELAETEATTSKKNTEAVSTDGRGGYNHGYNNDGGRNHNGGGGHYNGGGDNHNGGGGNHNGGGHGGGGGGGCRHGYCHHRCCNYAGEVVDAKTTEVMPQN